MISRTLFSVSLALGLAILPLGCGSENESAPNGLDEHGAVDVNVAASSHAEQALSPCTVSGVALGSWYSQNDTSWKTTLLGNSATDTIGAQGCVIACLSMAYTDMWSVPTTPAQLNTSAKSATPSCFAAGSSLVDVNCAINSRGGPHFSTDLANLAAVRTAVCAGYPVMVDVSWGGGHKMLIYHYTGGMDTLESSYKVIDPWDGTSKFLTGYSDTRWRKLY